jgi:hypothetical protein
MAGRIAPGPWLAKVLAWPACRLPPVPMGVLVAGVRAAVS